MVAVKHGNGRDWWIILHGINDTFYIILFTPIGIETIKIQNIGPIYNELIWNDCAIKDIGQIAASSNGNKIALSNFKINSLNSIDLFDFNRCSGKLNNWKIVDSSFYEGYYGCAFSSKGKYLYISTINTAELFQYDLSNNSLPYSRAKISQGADYGYYSQIQIALNKKIYIASANNEFLHIINNPNEYGTSCNLSENGLYLNGYKSQYGLPNIPNFKLGPLLGSACDTLSIVQPNIPPEELWNDTIPADETEEADIFIPNIFSPNNDGQNDVFYVYSTNIKTMTLMIFNRWDEMVFETNAMKTGWDGIYKGEPEQLGVYVYYLEAELMSGEKYTKRGTVSLVR